MTTEENKFIDNNDIGALLRKTREERGLSVSAVALQSTLDVSIIEKLEENRFSEISAPVFTRGYLNLYARCLGLNEAKINEAFNNLKADPTPKLRITEANAASQNKTFKRNHTGTWVFVIVTLLAFGLLLQQALDSKSWLVTQINRAFDSSRVQEGQQSDNSGQSEIILAVNGEPISNQTTSSEKNATSTVPTLESTNNQDHTVSTENDVYLESNEATNNNLSHSSENNQSDQDLTLVSLDSVNDVVTSEATDSDLSGDSKPVIATGGALHFSNESWIQVNDASGKVVKIGTLKKGETIDLPASGAPYKLNIGRPNNVSLTIGGENKVLKDYQQGNSERRFTVDIPNG